MVLFSVHPNQANLGNHALYSKGFSVKYPANNHQLSTLLTAYLNSPIIWSYGVRRDSNFQSAEFCVLDVDHGPTLKEAKETFTDYVHILGTTKSHQKDKGGKVKDRYRVFIRTEGKITQAPMYKHMNELIAKQYGGDLQACGAHMAFMPLTKIISVRDEGKLLPLVEPPPVVIRREKWTSNATYSGIRRIPAYIERYLAYGAAEGERNLTCFKAASGLAKLGFSEDEILTIILNSQIPLDRSDRVTREVQAAVRSAIRRR